jgi:hypothetical protein
VQQPLCGPAAEMRTTRSHHKHAVGS